MNSPLPWTFEEMTTTVVVRDARGMTVCNIPKQADWRRRIDNAALICAAVNQYGAKAIQE